MLQDIAYSVLKENKRAYEILLLRDQYSNTFADIAREYGISHMWARALYSRIKTRQIRLYITRIAIALGHKSTKEISNEFSAANECYQDYSYACAYLEKKYKDILEEYRNGEPGSAESFINNLPPLKRLGKKTISRIVEMRDAEKLTFIAIAKKLRITPEKARRTYDMFFHRQVLDYVEALQEKAESDEEKRAILYHYFRNDLSAKKRYELMISERHK